VIRSAGWTGRSAHLNVAPTKQSVGTVKQKPDLLSRPLDTYFDKTLKERRGIEVECTGNHLAVERIASEPPHPVKKWPFPNRSLAIQFCIHGVGTRIECIIGKIGVLRKCYGCPDAQIGSATAVDEM